MELWKEFEINCTEYLNTKFGNLAKFIHQGGADSTVPDIFVKTVFGNTFYMETKHSPAHSLGCNLLGLPLIKYPPVLAKTPPP